MNVIELDRVMIAVDDLEEAVAAFEALLGLSFDPPVDSRVETPAGIQRSVIAYGHPGIEIITPDDEDAELVQFLDSRGPGLFGAVLRVDDLDSAGSELAASGIDPIAEESPGAARELHYHPRSFAGVYLILTEYEHPAF